MTPSHRLRRRCRYPAAWWRAPRGGYTFQNWAVTGGSATIANDRSLSTTVTVNSDATVTAIFERAPTTTATYSLIVTRNLQEGGTTTPVASQTGITAGTPVNISATPSSGYIFVEWTVTSGTASFVNADFQNTTVILRSDATIMANFQAAYTLTVNVGPSGGGTVSPAGQSTVTAGTQVSITATAASGYMFLGWSVIRGPADIAEPKSASTTVTLSGDATVIASFQTAQTVQTYTLTVNINPPDGGATVPISSRTNLTEGYKVTIVAYEANGYEFVNWTVISGGVTIEDPGSAATTATMGASDGTITANFRTVQTTVQTYTLTVNSNNTSYGTVSPTSKSGVAAGQAVNISATPTNGYEFVNWTVTSGAATIGNLNSAAATVTLVASDATVTANFQQQVTPPPGGIGSFHDNRNGQTYKTVKIGSQTWMAENLNYPTDSSRCYNNSCAKYGRLYAWNAAKNACDGMGAGEWHLPTQSEWDALVNHAGGNSTAGKKLKSTSGWNNYNGVSGNGTDDFGFSALPGGSYGPSFGDFGNAGDDGCWWSATEYDAGYAYGRYMGYRYDSVGESYKLKSVVFSVRCVKDP